ncbi:MAG: hypothetical protein H6818_22895 [Phycisphaerales bacterium]|nr:hypothetical protein [Phycisphaerales bacterium]
MKRFIPLVAGIVFILTSANQVVIAQVVFDDGATHTVPGDPAFADGQSISVQSASSLVIQMGAQVIGSEHIHHQATQGGFAIVGQIGTSVVQQGGDVIGGIGNTAGSAMSLSTIIAAGGTGIRTEGTYDGVGGTLTGGFGMAASATDGATGVSNSVLATGGTALMLSAGASATLSGVEVLGGEADARFAQSENVAFGGAALHLDDCGPVVVTSGSFTGGTGTGNALSVNTATATGFGGAAIDVLGSSSLTINGGTFHGGVGAALTIFLPAPAVGVGGAALRIVGPSNVTINGGEFNAGAGGALTIPPAVPVTDSDGALRIVGDDSPGDLQVTINGGSFSGFGFALQTLGTSPQAGEARIDIRGGDFSNNSGGDISLGNPDIVTTIYGSGFEVDGMPVATGAIASLMGTLSGTLADGSMFEWDFERLNGAELHLADACDSQNSDVPAFVAAVLSASMDPSVVCMFDANADGALDGADIQGFVARLLMP